MAATARAPDVRRGFDSITVFWTGFGSGIAEDRQVRKAFGYCRVSSPGQSIDARDGLPRQREAITKFAAAKGIRITQWFEDAITGKTDLDHRPALQALMAALHANGVKLILVEKVDRLARDLMVQESIIADLQRNGFELVSTCEPDLCSSDPTRILIRQILGAFSQYERSMIVLKLRGARVRAKAKDPEGRCEGRKRFGFRPGEPEAIKRIQQLSAEGLPVSAICRTLNDEGVPTRYGKSWYPQQILKLLRRINKQSPQP
jgi:DNA invertase Pin-like site-specific DNA recombinase